MAGIRKSGTPNGNMGKRLSILKPYDRMATLLGLVNWGKFLVFLDRSVRFSILDRHNGVSS